MLDKYFLRVMVRIVNLILPTFFRMTRRYLERCLDDENHDDELIVSLTSFPGRIDKVWLTVETLIRQSVKPNKVILWISQDEFRGVPIGRQLNELTNYGLSIRFCKDNLYSHKKYYDAFRCYPKATIVTVDDDMLYPPDFIDKLLKWNLKHPRSICCLISRNIAITDGRILPYRQWPYVLRSTEPQFANLVMSGGGTLFPPGSLHRDVLDKDAIHDFALTTDDLWLKVMSLRVGTRVACLAGEYSRFPIPVIHRNRESLTKVNVGGGVNDIVFTSLMDRYGLSAEIFES